MQAQLRAGRHLVASQVLEIIDGAAYEAPRTAQEPEDSQDWLAEEGDDSVFYSDEDLGPKATGGGTDEDDGAGAWIREGPEVEEDRTELQRPNSEPVEESAAADPGSAPEQDTKMEARVQKAASGTGKRTVRTCTTSKAVCLHHSNSARSASQLIRWRT